MMDSKNYAEVLIDGNVYTLAGTEEKSYFQKVAGYLNGKINELKSVDGFLRQTPDYQNVLIQLNVADDYFKAAAQADEIREQLEAQEKELYSLKHQLVMTQLKLEEMQKEAGVSKDQEEETKKQ